MKDKEQLIINYIDRLTMGFIKIKPAQARYIIKLATADTERPVIVEKFEYKALKNSYEFIKSFQLEEDQVKTVFHKFSRVNIPGFYRYDYKGPDGNIIASIHNLNANLFD